MGLRFDGKTYDIDELAAIRWVKDAKDEAVHTHRFVELVYIRKGRCTHTIDGTQYPVTRGDMLLINEAQQHSLVCQPGTEYINILIKPKIISESMGQSANAFSLLMLKDFSDFRTTVNQSSLCVHFRGAERNDLEMLLNRLHREQRESCGGSSLMLRSGLNMLLILVFRAMALPMCTAQAGVNDSLLAHIREHCADRLSLEALAEARGYEPSYFSRLFKQYTGRTFTAYLTACRMERAQDLLENTQRSVDTVISECGFSDRTKFFRLFAAHTGMTPLQYRKSKN